MFDSIKASSRTCLSTLGRLSPEILKEDELALKAEMYQWSLADQYHARRHSLEKLLCAVITSESPAQEAPSVVEVVLQNVSEQSSFTGEYQDVMVVVKWGTGRLSDQCWFALELPQSVGEVLGLNRALRLRTSLS